MITALIYTLLGALTFRIRGGLRIPLTDKKFPLNKWWFAVFFALGTCYLKGWHIDLGLTCLIAGYMCTAISGWGSFIMSLLKGSPASEEANDDLNITYFVKHKLFPAFNWFAKWCENHKGFRWLPKKMVFLTKTYKEAPRAYGFFTVSLRGGLTTFILGLALNSVPYMFVGLLQGAVYWLGGWTCRHVYDDGKYGWRWAEIFWGMVLGISLNLFA